MAHVLLSPGLFYRRSITCWGELSRRSLEDVAGFIPPPATDVYIHAAFPTLSALSLQLFSTVTITGLPFSSIATLVSSAPEATAAGLTLITLLLVAGA